MRVDLARRLITSLGLALALAAPVRAQQDTFRWMDFHSAKDQDIIVWVTRALEAEKWTSIREIGVDVRRGAGGDHAAHQPAKPLPAADTFNLWSISLTTHAVTPLFKGVNLRLLDWMQFGDGTLKRTGRTLRRLQRMRGHHLLHGLHYDRSQHIWKARWMRGGQAAPIWSAATPEGVTLTRVYAVLSGPNGRQLLGTWSHFDYGKQKTPRTLSFATIWTPSAAWSGLEF